MMYMGNKLVTKGGCNHKKHFC